MPTTGLQAQRKAILYRKALLYKLGSDFMNLTFSVVECIHTDAFLSHSLIFTLLLLTNFLGDTSGLPPNSLPWTSQKLLTNEDADRKVPSEKAVLKAGPAQINLPYG